MLHSNCHTHTVFCDGKNTPEEMVLAAMEQGFTCLGFSFHAPMTPDAVWTIRPEMIPAYTAEIRRLQQTYADKIEILHGIELDRDSCGVDLADYDYVIAAVHQLTKGDLHYDVDSTADDLRDCCRLLYGGDWLRLAADYYDRLAQFVIRVRPTIVAHFDLIEKFNEDGALFDTNNPAYQALACKAADAILDACPDVLFEVNTGAMYRCGKKQPYPAAFLLRRLHKRGARVIVTADAHTTDALCFAFDKALDAIGNAGFDTVYELRRVDGKAKAMPLRLA
jgi:histidinol-phosphatase (PHP family)